LAAIDRETKRYHRQLVGVEPWPVLVAPELREYELDEAA
jgi:hypothetical protein